MTTNKILDMKIVIVNHGPQFGSKNWYLFYCPNCNYNLGGNNVKTCTKCGQALEEGE